MTNKEAKEIIESECYVFNPLNLDRTTKINTALDVAIEALELTSIKEEPKSTREDIMTIHTQGLDEAIRCTMCTNSMKSDRGCDGGCVVNEAMYKVVMNTIRNHIVPPVTPKKDVWIPCSERLPEPKETENLIAKYYLVQNEYGDMMVARWDGKGWEQMYQHEYLEEDDVIAWMPLPEKYKAEREGEE